MNLSRRTIAACSALAIAWALVVPLAQPASATHPTGSCLDVTPESATNTLGTAHELTATLRTGTNQNCTGNLVTHQGGSLTVNFEITGPSDPDAGNTPATVDITCDIRNNRSSCTATYTGTAAGTDTILGWIDHDGDGVIDADDPQDSVTKVWVAGLPAGSVLDCDDASGDDAETNPAGASETYACTLTQPDGPDAGTTPDPVANIRIDAENLNGANDPDNSGAVGTADINDACTTGASGTCTIVIAASENQTGSANICFWADVDADTVFDPNGEAADGGGCSGETAVTEDSDTIDVVTKTWTVAAASLAISPSSDTGSVGTCNPFTITVRDAAGQALSGATVDIEQTHVRATNNTANDEPTVAFCVPTSGPNPSDVDVNRGDLRENPDNLGTAGGETRQATDVNGQVTIGVTVTAGQGSDGTGTVSVVAFVESTDNDDPDAGEPQATATKTWVVQDARTIDCEPESAANATGTTHTVTCTVRDRFGDLVAGEGVTLSESGPGDLTSATQVTTNAQGVATATVRSATEAGTQTITGTLTDALTAEPNVDECERAANDPAGAPAGVCADAVTKTWSTTAPVTCPGFEADTRNQIVGTVDGDQLLGTEGDDIICALGGDDIVDALGGDDLILLGGGNDGAFGRAGNDDIRGAGGDDIIAGGDGSDRIRGGAGHDGLKGNARGDVLRGGIGNDILVGGPGTDNLLGGAGADNLQGGSGNDLLNGGRGFDTCLGGRGSDVFRNCERRR